MGRFASYDGTELEYHVRGEGRPVICLPGGPGRAAEYLRDLGGLDASRQLVLLDLRGVGGAPMPADPETLRVDRLVEDVEALRVHLGLERFDLLAHSAGSVLATLYAAAYPERLSRLVLITPGLAAVGVYPTEEQFDAVVARLKSEPWYPDAMAALEKFSSGDLSYESFAGTRPLFYGRWDEAASVHATEGFVEQYLPARLGYFDGVTLDVEAIRAALTRLTAPVLLYAGDFDPIVTPAMAAEAAPLFNGAEVVVQPAGGHFPWLDDPTALGTAIAAFLG